MKRRTYNYRYIIFVTLVFIPLISFAQSVYMHEAEEDAIISDSLSFRDLLWGCGLILISFLCFWGAQKLKKASLIAYKKFLKISLILFFSFFAILFISFSLYHSYNHDEQEKKATESFSRLCNNADTYVNPCFSTDIRYCAVEEIDVKDFDKPNDQIYRPVSYMKNILGFDNSGTNGAYYCYHITNSPVIDVVYAKSANRILRTEDDPSLYHCFVRPYRIRYFNQNPNPGYDIINAYVNFRKTFIINNNSHMVGDSSHFTYEALSSMLENNYFKITSINGGDEIWNNNHVMIPECVYEYATVNYGDFEIMYCVTQPSRYGIEEAFIETPKGKFENRFEYEREKTYFSLFRICGFLFIPLVCALGYGYWGRKKDDN